MTTTNLLRHMKTIHSRIRIAKHTPDTSGETSGIGQLSYKKPPAFNLFKIRNKTQRKELFMRTIPKWKEPSSVLKLSSGTAQKYHKILFEKMILDLDPFHEVNKPGFLRYNAVIAPTFEIASEKYYRYAHI